ncbi:MAG: diaminopimelate decarboxylase [Microscillaceae bacterium]|jgi:diaminopimelate decarboxylase|nr:diaminopimelate decarboxylase [Microscillaceae bacterium]
MKLTNHQYQIQGLSILDICEQYTAPLYLYDGNKMVEQIDLLRSAYQDLPLKIKFAAKALTNISVLKLFQKQGIGLDVVSLQEVHLGLLAGFLPQDIQFTPSGVSFAEIQAVVDMGVMINLDSLPALEKFGEVYGSSVPVSLRINPHVMAGGNAKISVGHIDSKFGISIAQLPQILAVVKDKQLTIKGLHVHTGSDIFAGEVFMQVANVMFKAAKHFKNLQFIDFGGGFKVAYKKGDKTTDMHALAKNMHSAYAQFCEDYGKKVDIYIEPGKFLVSEAGYFLVKTNVVKQTPNATFVGVDSGLNHLIRPMFYDAYHDMFNASNPEGDLQTYNIVGYICETDTFGNQRQLNEVREGDIICIKNAGAYGFMMSSNYNSRFRPAEVLVYNGKSHLIRQHETMDDILRNQILVDVTEADLVKV